MGQVDGEGMMGTVLFIAGIGLTLISVLESAWIPAIFAIAACPLGALITWDDWSNKQELMNRFLRKVCDIGN